MKKIIFLFVSLVVSTMCYAQSTMMATLSHEGKIQVFYGAHALKNAHAASAAGDVITLSAGTFVATDITKPITLRGAGAGVDTTAHTENTILTGDFNIKVKNTENARLTLEGFYSSGKISIQDTLSDATFLKCMLKSVTNTVNSRYYVEDLKMIHCIVSDGLDFLSNSTLVLINSVFPVSKSSSHPIFSCQNCIILGLNYYILQNSEFRNCVFANSTPYIDNKLHSSCVAYNCISTNNYTFRNMTNKTNTVVNGLSTIFKTYNGEFSEEERYELTDAAKTAYKGTDGKEVGIHGGNMVFNFTPTNPRIVKCNVAEKTTSDGKLKVELEVRSAQ